MRRSSSYGASSGLSTYLELELTQPRSRSTSESAVKASWRCGRQFPDAVLIRPAVMFGPDDAFLTPVLNLLRRLPVFPMFGGGLTRLQPVYVEDVAEAVAARAVRGHRRDDVRVRRPSYLHVCGLFENGHT